MSLIKPLQYPTIKTRSIFKRVVMTLLPRLKRTPIKIWRCGLFKEDPIFKNIRKLKEQKKGMKKESMRNCIVNHDFIQLMTPQEGVFFQNDRFEILADCKEFRPQNIHCTVTDQYVEIRAGVQANEGTGMSHKQSGCHMCRRFQMPRNINPQMSECYLSSDGMLFVTGPWSEN